jgi:hypothetical protein
MRVSLAVLCVLILGGCATRTYDWGNYDSRLYQYYKSPTTAEAFRVALETHLGELEARMIRPAPGLYAELGTLYLEHGDRVSAARYYTKERDVWPESRFMMDALLSNLQKYSKEDKKK